MGPNLCGMYASLGDGGGGRGGQGLLSRLLSCEPSLPAQPQMPLITALLGQRERERERGREREGEIERERER